MTIRWSKQDRQALRQLKMLSDLRLLSGRTWDSDVTNRLMNIDRIMLGEQITQLKASRLFNRWFSFFECPYRKLKIKRYLQFREERYAYSPLPVGDINPWTLLHHEIIPTLRNRTW